MVTDQDRSFDHPELPKYSGRIRNIEKFDAQFFRVHYKQANVMDPMTRKLLEHAYGAIYDAGINPVNLRGKKIGVFVGAAFADAEKNVYDVVLKNGFVVTGNVKCMHSNRISYWMDAKGPSYSIDMNCASSAACLEHAYRSINSGQCEAAIVGGCNLSLNPMLCITLARAGFLCMDGKTKCFDKNGDGYVKSDAINVLFLQKAKHAKRIYCELYFAKMIYDLKSGNEFLPVRPVQNIKDFLQGIYSEIDVSPEEVEYVEANACGIAEADGNELEAIGQVFATKRPVKVGSVKSNMGHGEAASGICSVIKLCLAYQEGKMPANLHYYDPQFQVPAVGEGRIEIVQENTAFNRGFTAINNFSYGGCNIHILLKGHYKPKDIGKYKTNLPRLVLVSGRHEAGVIRILDALENQPVDPELIGLLHDIYLQDIPGHVCRGSSILTTNEKNETLCLSRSMEYCPGTKRPVWFVYSGMGSQWTGMGAELMAIPSFTASIKRCHKALLPKGIDIIRILTEKDETTFDNILNSFVGIAAMQIALTDVLTEMGIVPDNIIGHSVGELGCAYADNCLTSEEMILSAYYRGLVSIQTSFIPGSMAAVGLGYADISALCPPEIDVACHNSNESSTISGPAENVEKFVMDLKKQNIFAKEVLCSNIAYHSRYVARAGPGLLKYLREVIRTPKMRSEKWISTSVPIDKWDDDVAKLSSAEYFTNNLLNPVLFEETSKLIPQNALVIEIAPHGLLQAILKRSLSNCLHIPLTRKKHENPVKFLLESIRTLYEAGLNPKISILYPTIQYPVSTTTALLSHFVDWEHSEDWTNEKYETSKKIVTHCRDIAVSLHDYEYKCLQNCTRNGKCVLPEATLLIFVWETLAMTKGINYKTMSVTFRNIQFHDEVFLSTDAPLMLSVNVSDGSNRFQVTCGDNIKMTGFIYQTNITIRKSANKNQNCGTDNELTLSSTDIYRLLYYKGYSYNSHSYPIDCTNYKFNKALLKWNGDWVSFLDGLLQLNVLSRGYSGVSLPKLINELKICVKTQNVEEKKTSKLLAEVNNNIGLTRCGGVELKNICYTDLHQTVKDNYTLQSKIFIPHYNWKFLDIHTVLYIIMQIVSENNISDEMNIVEISDDDTVTLLDTIKMILERNSSALFDVDTFNLEKINFQNLADLKENFNLLLIYDLLGDFVKMKQLNEMLSKAELVLAVEYRTCNRIQENPFFTVVANYNLGNQSYILLRKKEISEKINYVFIPDNGHTFELETTKYHEKSQYVVLVSENSKYCRIAALMESLRRKRSHRISILIIDDCTAPKFNPTIAFYKDQIQKHLTLNIFKQGHWGGFYYLPCSSSAILRSIKLTSNGSGDLDKLIWFKDNPLSNSLSVKVSYAGLSRKDVQKALEENVNSTKREYGMDFSGMNTSNQKVMGVVKSGAVSSEITAEENLLWPVPDHWSLEEAATVLLPYVLAYYSLIIKGKLENGSRVFITGGLDSFGQAAISICLAYDCEVFTVVSNQQKKKFLLALFPKLKENNVISTCYEAFYEEVIQKTNKLRCHIVINNFTGNLRQASIKCVGPFGKFVDLSNLDIHDNKPFGMNFLFEGKSNINIDLFQIFKPENTGERQIIQQLLAAGIIKGYVKPLTRVVFSPDNICRAFQFVSHNSDTGRVLIKMTDVANLAINVQPRISCSPEGSFVIFSDGGDLGIELADRLVKRGARNLLIHTYSDICTDYIHIKTLSWERQGVTVKLVTAKNELEIDIAKCLNAARELGQISGIFFIPRIGLSEANEEISIKSNETVIFLTNLDFISRKMCPELREFVVIAKSPKSSCDKCVASALETICEHRNKIKIPALYFRTTVCDEFDNTFLTCEPKINSQCLEISSVLNALEASLNLPHNNVIVFPIKEDAKKDDFFVKVSNIFDIKCMDDIPDDVKLADISTDESTIGQIRSLLKEQYNICNTMDTVQEMTISELKTLTRGVNVKNSDFNVGLGAFCTYVDDDECMGYEPVVSMTTMIGNANEAEDMLYQESAYLMLIPGIEGHRQIFESICKRLKVHAMTLQLAPDLVEESIHQTAENILKIMKKRFDLKSKFYIMGYSFGVNVALELAALLEKSGHIGVVYCLDSSPDAVRVHLNAYLGTLAEMDTQNEILEHMYKLMSNAPCGDLRKDLEKLDCWHDKVLMCVKKLKGLVNYSYEYIRAVLEAVYRRIWLCMEYEPDLILESQLVLMKGIPHPNADKLPFDYNLSKYTKQPVRVFDLNSDHALAPQDLKVPDIINEFLDTKILEEFKKKNLCISYVTNRQKIVW